MDIRQSRVTDCVTITLSERNLLDLVRLYVQKRDGQVPQISRLCSDEKQTYLTVAIQSDAEHYRNR